MSEDRDNRLSDLYRQSSQETPPVHLDRAVLDMARKSMRRRVFAPFGNHWAAGGVLVGVVVLSVLLVLTVPQSPESYTPEEAVGVPSRDVTSMPKKEPARLKGLPSERLKGKEEKRAAPAAPKARSEFHNPIQDMEATEPEADTYSVRRQDAITEDMSGTVMSPVEIYYLQAGSFNDRARADALKKKLAGLGFACEIREASAGDREVKYRVRVGPFTDRGVLEQTRQKLDELGIKTQAAKYRD